jgi:hypothetical protein
MKCKLALVAKDVIISQTTGVPSAINIMEGIQTSGFPLLLHEISYLTVWSKESGDPDEFDGHLVVAFGAVELVREKFSVSFGGKGVARNVATFQGLVLPEPGSLDFRCEFPGCIATCAVGVSAFGKVETTTTN